MDSMETAVGGYTELCLIKMDYIDSEILILKVQKHEYVYIM